MFNHRHLQFVKPDLGAHSGFQVMLKPCGPACNLDCQYCYYLTKRGLYPHSDFRMTDDVLEEFTQQYIHSQQKPVVTFIWQGGEPTQMELDFYRKAVALQHKYQQPGTTVYNALQTNATLINDEWAKFFKQNKFLIGVSLDGPKQYHDVFRIDKGGKPTFDRVITGLDILKKHKVDFNLMVCVNAANVNHPLKVYRFLRDQIGARFIQFIPIVEQENLNRGEDEVQVSRQSIQGKQYGHFLIRVFDEWVTRDVGNVFVQIFDIALGVWLGQPARLCVFEETCGRSLAMEHNGDIYACDHFVEPEFYLGNISSTPLPELVRSSKQAKIGSAKSKNLPAYCMDCDVRFICNGGCPKNRILVTPGGEPGLNYLCEGYRSFFKHIDRPMKLMAALIRMGRPPADVMRILLKEGYRGGTGPLGTKRLPKVERKPRSERHE